MVGMKAYPFSSPRVTHLGISDLAALGKACALVQSDCTEIPAEVHLSARCDALPGFAWGVCGAEYRRVALSIRRLLFRCLTAGFLRVKILWLRAYDRYILLPEHGMWEDATCRRRKKRQRTALISSSTVVAMISGLFRGRGLNGSRTVSAGRGQHESSGGTWKGPVRIIMAKVVCVWCQRPLWLSGFRRSPVANRYYVAACHKFSVSHGRENIEPDLISGLLRALFAIYRPGSVEVTDSPKAPVYQAERCSCSTVRSWKLVQKEQLQDPKVTIVRVGLEWKRCARALVAFEPERTFGTQRAHQSSADT